VKLKDLVELEKTEAHMHAHPVVVGVVCFLAGGALGAGVIWGGEQLLEHDSRSKSVVGTQVRSGGYQFINPLLECEIMPESGVQELRPASETVRRVINQYVERGVLTDSAVYFRDLNNGPWFGSNERALFAPASLFKVPLMVAVLKQAESNPSLLSQVLEFEAPVMESLVTQNIDPSTPIEPGKSYTVEELLERMIAQSDNEAMALLSTSIDEQSLLAVERDLGLVVAEGADGERAITVKSYAGIFRMLFNASYLNRQMSEKALGILSKSAYTAGIPAKLPDDIIVAHKFGERVMSTLDGTVQKQLHDCGIVYFPDRPYLLCVMTRGSDLQQLTKVVRDVSEVVYNDVLRQSMPQSSP
jgi:beta-lactamase class A